MNARTIRDGTDATATNCAPLTSNFARRHESIECDVDFDLRRQLSPTVRLALRIADVAR